MLVRSFCAAVLALCSLAQIGCNSVPIKGKVIQGEVSYALLVNEDDERLAQPGIASAVIKVRTEPGKLGSEVIADTISDEQGEFNLSISRMVLDPVEVSVERPGFARTRTEMRLRGENTRLLIILTPGNSRAGSTDDIRETLERFK